MLVNGLRASPRVFMSTRSAEPVFVSIFNSTSRFPQGAVTSVLLGHLHVPKRSEAEQI